MKNNKFWLQGFNAAAEGKVRNDNPYKNLSKQFEMKKIWWDIGWDNCPGRRKAHV